MIIRNTEKRVLQKYYAKRIESRVANLEEIIQRDEQDVLANIMLDIKGDATRICQIQNEWRNDSEKERIEEAVYDVNK